MARPRIVRETRKEPGGKEPPGARVLRPHPWYSEESACDFAEAVRSGRTFDAYITAEADLKIRDHASAEARNNLEVMGLLLGEVNTWNGKTYTFVRKVGTTDLKSSASKVRFDPDAFPKLFGELDDSGFDYLIVGWYHSHPGHTCFLSRTDIQTQRTMFSQSYHLAIVVDPVNEEFKVFGLRGDSYESRSFALVDQDPIRARGKAASRRRRLKVKPVTSV